MPPECINAPGLVGRSSWLALRVGQYGRLASMTVTIELQHFAMSTTSTRTAVEMAPLASLGWDLQDQAG